MCMKNIERYFEAPWGYVLIHLGAARLGEYINHISPRCLKITYTKSTWNHVIYYIIQML
jgi:hypothetical protein